jgi:hypothetical protein
MNLLLTFRTVAALIVLSALYTSAAPPKTEAEAGVIVTNLVRTMGNLESFERPEVTRSAKRGEYSFFYRLKPPGVPGGYFVVVVDADGKPTYRGGR